MKKVSLSIRYLEINPAFELHTGIKRENVLGKSFLDVFTNTDFKYTDSFVEVALSGKSTNFEMFSPATGNHFEVHAFSPEKGKLAAIFNNITGRKQMEESLHKSEERYRGIVETANECIIITDKEAIVTYTNKRLEDMFGYSLEEVIGRPIWGFISAESKAIFELLPENGWQGINESLEAKLIRKDGSFIWSHVNVKSLIDQNGQFMGVLGMLTDITERKNMEEALRKSEEKFLNIVETANEGISLNNSEGVLTYVNPKMAEMIGDDVHEIIGRNLLEFVEDIDDSIALDNMQRQFQDDIQSYDFKLLRKDGLPLWVFVNLKSFFDDNGKFIGSLNMFTDITKRKEAEFKLKETLENLEDIIEVRTAELETTFSSFIESEKSLAEAQKMAHIGSWKWAIATGEIHWSDELFRIFGLIPQKIGLPFNEVLNYTHPDDRDYVGNAIKRAFSGESFDIEFKIILANGEERTVHAQTEVIFDEKTTPVQMKGIVQDITERKKAEEKIQILANVVESSNDAIITKSLNDIIISWNKGAEQVYGYSAEEVLGQPISMVPSYSDHETKKLSEMIKHGAKVHQYEISRLRKDGKLIDVSLNLSPVFDSSGRLTAISIIARDITERKKMEEKLRESEEKYRNIVETSNEGIIIVDDEAIITYANKKMVDMIGYTLEESVGRQIWGFLSEEFEAVLKLNLKKRWMGIDGSYESRLIRKDGSPIWVHINAKSLFDKNGEFIGVLGLLTDITESKIAEEKLRESEEKYRNIVETANEGMLVTDKESIITYVNKKMADMVGYTVEESIGRSIWDFLSEESKYVVKSNLNNRQQGIDNLYESQLIQKDGSLIWVHINAKCLFDKNGEFIGSLGMLNDITKRKEAEETLAKIEIGRKQEIHHRIKNNLQVISSLLDLQAEKFNNREDIKDSEVLEAFKESQDRVISMALIHEELYRGGGLDSLDFSSYTEVLAKNLFLSNRLGNIDISIKLDLVKNAFFNMDIAVPLGIIVNELVSNSFKHAFPGRSKGEIQIKLRREENGECIKSINEDCKSTSFTLTVSDNGVGIPENFDIEDLNTLGMQLVTSLVDQLDGEFELKSDNGTEFFVKFTVIEKSNQAPLPALKQLV